MPIYDAAMRYAEEGTPLVVLAGKEYGSGSSRDWAAKGTNLLGVRAVIARSFERIHRSNLVGMGVLPLQFADGESAESLGLTGEEELSITRDRERRGQGGHGPRGRQGVHRAGADRHPEGGPVLPARRHPAVRAAPAARARTPDRRPPAKLPRPMPVPEVLRKLLTAPGPSGYEQAAAAVFRDAAGAFAEVSHDTVGSTVARVKGTADGPLLAVIGHIDEIGLIVHHIDDDGFLWFSGVGGWDPVILVGQRVEIATRDGVVPRRRRQEADPPAQGGGAQAGPRAAPAAHRHRRGRRRRRARPRADRRRRGDRGRAARVPERPRRLALDGQPARLLRRLRGRAAGRRGRRRARRRRGRRGHAGGDHVRGRAHDRVHAPARRRDRRRRHVLHRRARLGGEGDRLAQVRLRPGDHARLDARPAGVRAAARDRRGGGHPVHGRRHRRATRAPTPTRCTSRAAASPRASSRSRCATCTRRSRWCSSTTSRTRRS